MPTWEPKKNGNGNGESKDLARIPGKKIVVQQCHCCTHPQRDVIDRLLAVKYPYSEIARLFEVDRRSASNHAKEHLNYDDAAIRQIIEYEAQRTDENLEQGIRGAFARRATLDVAIRQGFEALVNGEVVVEPKDLPKLIELREKLDKDSEGAAVEELMVQFNAFKQAVLELADPALKWNILERTKEILDTQGTRVALQPGEDGSAQKPDVSDSK